MADVEEVTRRRAEAMRRLMDEQPWDAACMVFVSPDRIQHCLLEYVHPGHPDHATASRTPVAERVIDVYRLLDRELGTLLERTDADDLVLLMSDHGHQPVTRALNMNRVLESMGCLRMGRGSALVSLLAWGRIRSLARVAYDRLGLHGKVKVPTTPIDWAHTTAYTSVTSTGEGVSIALAGREPQGTVPGRGLRAGARPRSRTRCSGFVDPATGRHPIARGAAQGGRAARPYLDRAPDLLLEPAPLYSLTHARQIVEPADWLSGDHRPEGVYVAAGPGITAGAGEEISLADFAGWIEPRWASRSRPAPTRPSSRRWASSRTRGARGRGAAPRSRLPRLTGSSPSAGAARPPALRPPLARVHPVTHSGRQKQHEQRDHDHGTHGNTILSRCGTGEIAGP